MPQNVDFAMGAHEDGNLTIVMTPSVPVGGWAVEFTMTRRFGGDALVTKGLASGLPNGASGVTVLNSGTGVFAVALHPAEVSGLAPGAYAYQFRRLDSGAATDVARGLRLME